MGRSRTIEVTRRKATLALGIVCLAVAGVATFLTQSNWGRSFTLGDLAETARDPAALRAEEAATALTAIDYRDPEGFLNRLRPLVTERAYAQLKLAFVGIAWPGLEEREFVISPEQVAAMDMGVAGEGDQWQARKVMVVVADPPEGEASRREVLLQLVEQEGEWRVQTLLSDAQLALLLSLPASGAQAEHGPLQGESAGEATEKTAVGSASSAAAAFARAFVAMDYRDEGMWLARLKGVTSDGGYVLIRDWILIGLWPKVAENRLVIPFEQTWIEDLGVEAWGKRPLEEWQVRRVHVHYPPTGAGDDGEVEYLVRVVRGVQTSSDESLQQWVSSGIVSDPVEGTVRAGGG